MTHKNKTILLFAFLFSLVSFPSFASGDGVSDTIGEILKIGVNIDTGSNNLDYFQLWLSYVFGTFIFKPWTGADGSISVLSHALGYMNVIAMLFGTIMMSYIFGGGALNSATSGEVLGKSWSTGWMVMRTSLGIGMLLPVKGIGGGVFGFAQLGIIWLILLGSNSATHLWNVSVDKMKIYGTYGSSINPAITSDFDGMVKIMICADQKVKNERKGGLLSFGVSGNTFTEAQVATINYKKYGSEVEDQAKNKVKSYTSTIKYYTYETKQYPIKERVIKEKGGTYSYALSGITNLVSKVKDTSIAVTSITFPSCGTIVVPDALSDAYITSKKNQQPSNYRVTNDIADKTQQAKISHYKKLQSDVLAKSLESAFSVASSIGKLSNGDPLKAFQTLGKGSTDEKAKTELRNSLDSIYSSYSSASNFYQMSVSRTLPISLYDTIKNEKASEASMKYGGWAGAGLWFLKMGQGERSVKGASFQTPSSHIKDQNVVCSDLNVNKNEEPSKECINAALVYSSALKIFDDLALKPFGKSKLTETDTSGGGTSVSQKDDLETTIKSLECTEDCDISASEMKSLPNAFAGKILNMFANGLSDRASNGGSSDTSTTGGFFSLNGLQNPFLTLQNIGDNLIDFNTFIFAGILALNAFGEGVKNSAAAWFGAGAMSGIVQPIGMLLGALWISVACSGIVLAFMIPFMPIITWINMLVGYLITVIEAVAATPLAVIQLLTPEGQGIIGQRLERAVQLIIVVVIKPTLMIIGLLAGVNLSSIAFSIFNFFFWSNQQMYSTGGLITLLAMLFIYTTTALALTKLLVTIMHNLPNHILEWFSGGMNRNFGENSSGDLLDSASKQMQQKSDSALHASMRHGMFQNKKAPVASDGGGDKTETPDADINKKIKS